LQPDNDQQQTEERHHQDGDGVEGVDVEHHGFSRAPAIARFPAPEYAPARLQNRPPNE
jgi:hypothetical protein